VFKNLGERRGGIFGGGKKTKRPGKGPWEKNAKGEGCSLTSRKKKE